MLEKIETFDQNQNAFKYHQIQLNLQRNAIFVESSKIYFLLSPSTRTDIYIKMLCIDPQNTKKEQTRISLIALNSSLQLRCQGIFVESWNALERRISIWRESLLRPHSESRRSGSRENKEVRSWNLSMSG